MRIVYVSLFVMATAYCNAQNTAAHRSIMLPWYEGSPTNTDPKPVMLDGPLKAGDTILLSNGNLKLQKALLSFSTLGEINETTLKGNVISPKAATLLDDARGDRSALIILEIDSCVNTSGQVVKSYCNYRLRYQ